MPFFQKSEQPGRPKAANTSLRPYFGKGERNRTIFCPRPLLLAAFCLPVTQRGRKTQPVLLKVATTSREVTTQRTGGYRAAMWGPRGHELLCLEGLTSPVTSPHPTPAPGPDQEPPPLTQEDTGYSGVGQHLKSAIWKEGTGKKGEMRRQREGNGVFTSVLPVARREPPPPLQKNGQRQGGREPVGQLVHASSVTCGCENRASSTFHTSLLSSWFY